MHYAGQPREWTAFRFNAHRMKSMRAYVQQVNQDSSFYLSSLEASHWFWECGYEVVPFRFADIHSGQLDLWLLPRSEEMVVRAGVEAIRNLLARAGRPSPPVFDLPHSLSQWIGRFTWETTLGEVRNQVDSEVSFKHMNLKVERSFRPCNHIPNSIWTFCF